MILKIHKPAAPLDLFIDHFLYYKDYIPDHQLDRFFPDGNTYLVIDLTETPKSIYDNVSLKEIQSCKRIWFSGIRNQSITIPSGLEQEMIVVNFHKGKSYPFIKAPLHAFTNLTVDAELALNSEIQSLRDLLLACVDAEQMFAKMESHFLNYHIHPLVQNPFIDYSIQCITQSPEPFTIEKLTQKVGFSHRHFIKIFMEHVGMSPKQYMKIIRFQKAIHFAEEDPLKTWSEIAMQCGYYDLAHFHHEFKLFSGFSPKQYRKLHSDFTNYVAVG
ncbi:MAG: helix-turn-helix transcriptional regulator [Saprospiraceae bacterium]|nr:helix-turn-helix transcriptional regulator [Saprospiraceae bacterium]